MPGLNVPGLYVTIPKGFDLGHAGCVPGKGENIGTKSHLFVLLLAPMMATKGLLQKRNAEGQALRFQTVWLATCPFIS